MTTATSDVMTAEAQSATTPSGAIDRLAAGNARFVEAAAAERDLLAQVAATASGQHPFVAIVSCIDSRVPPEFVFDLGIGDAFVARTAGNVVDGDMLGSLEFATAVAGAKAVVVLGHSACGAVKGACDGVELGHLTGLLAKISPSVEAVAGEPTPGSGDADLVQKVVEQHVDAMASDIVGRSDVIAGLVESGDLVVAGAVYDLETGVVTWQ